MQIVQNNEHHELGRREVHEFREGQEVQTVSKVQVLGLEERRMRSYDLQMQILVLLQMRRGVYEVLVRLEPKG